MNITVFGAGYVGLVTGACLADVGNNVICVDVDCDKIHNLQCAKIPIFEPGLDALIAENSSAGRLSFTTDAEASVKHAEVIFIAVGTPPDEDGSADLSYVMDVAKTIARHVDHSLIVVNKSTVPVGTAEKVLQVIKQEINEAYRHLSIEVVSNPEFLKEGDAIKDFTRPDRIVIGAASKQAAETIANLYRPFNRDREKTLIMQTRSAELTKYAANAMLAAKISMMNEFANIAFRVGADIEEVRLGIGSDPRIGYQFIYPGLGYGGSCFPKDVQALARTAAEVGYDARLLDAIEAVNTDQKHLLFNMIKAHFNGQLSGVTIAIWGLAFKPNTDDMREAPSLTIIKNLLASGANIKAYDPEAMDEAQRILSAHDNIEWISDPLEVTQNADALAIITEWSIFRSPDFEQLQLNLNQPIVFDGRNLYRPEVMSARGFVYYSIGRAVGRIT